MPGGPGPAGVAFWVTGFRLPTAVHLFSPRTYFDGCGPTPGHSHG